MSEETASLALMERARPRAWVVVGATLAAGAATLALRFVFEIALKYVHWDPVHYGRYWSLRGWLAAHIAGGLVALLAGPVQLWSGARGRTAGGHRVRGRLYVFGVFVAVAGAFRISLFSPAFPAFGVPLSMLGATWLTITALACVAVWRGRVSLHRELMVRSYVLTFTFVVFRWWFELPILTHLPPAERYPAIAWLAWTVPLLLAELVIQGRKVMARPQTA